MHVVVAGILFPAILARGRWLFVQRLRHTVVLAATFCFGFSSVLMLQNSANQVAVGSLYRHLIFKRSTIAASYSIFNLLKGEIEFY